MDAKTLNTSRRLFGILDAMTIIVAIAFGAAVNRAQKWDWISVRGWGWASNSTFFGVYWVLLPYLWAMTLAVLALRLRHPRPRLIQLASQPGAVACTIALAVSVLLLAWVGALVVAGRNEITLESSVRNLSGPRTGFTYGGIGQVLLRSHGDKVGYAVLGAWFSLLIGGRWKPEVSWIDRAGRALGWCWLLTLPVFWLEYFLI